MHPSVEIELSKKNIPYINTLNLFGKKGHEETVSFSKNILEISQPLFTQLGFNTLSYSMDGLELEQDLLYHFRVVTQNGKDDEEGGGMMLIEPQHMIQSIFLDCDKDNDGALSASEYSAFLRTIGSWGKHKYTDENWVEQWCDHPPRPPAPLVVLVVLARHKKLVSASTLLVPDCAVLCCAVLCCTQAE